MILMIQDTNNINYSLFRQQVSWATSGGVQNSQCYQQVKKSVRISGEMTVLRVSLTVVWRNSIASLTL